MFSLIKWVEDGKFPVLPTDHIRQFDEDKYALGMEEKDLYLVEWRRGVKEPKGGWPVYEASTIKIAERERTLQIKLQEIEAQIPKPDTLKRKSKPSMKLLERAQVREQPAPKRKAHITAEENDLKVWNEKKIEHLQRVIKQLREENMTLSKENERLKNEKLEKIPPLILATEHLLREPIKSKANILDVSKPPPQEPLLYFPKPVESHADLLDTATSMVRALLMAAFPLEVLIHSNLKGGKSKTDSVAERRSALDKYTMAAIYIKKRFPNVSKGALGIAVNSKQGELRLLEKKKYL
ncbi:uncharacterized protein LOC130438063 isoform X2 [Triplophysa dalaica]|uniref:uncharacterized protein LOC130438063 isoform X2 n=1 Tax=Triplophysa dalaica TaxID=1582913 RepID=UPI0024DF8272|nr:uncharacterized protein LOC130438063 isoform X2 [Triplophysa dalaica]